MTTPSFLSFATLVRPWPILSLLLLVNLLLVARPLSDGPSPLERLAADPHPFWHNPPEGSELADSPELSLSLFRRDLVQAQIDHMESACLRIGLEDRGNRYREVLVDLLDQLRRSPLATELLRIAAERQVLLCFDWTTDLMAYYRSGINLIGLNPHLKPGKMIAYLAHELAHVPQHRVYSDNRTYAPQDLLLLRRMREAAAEAAATRIAWQLRLAGYDRAWTLKAADPFYGDIHQAFAAAMIKAEENTDSSTTLREVRATRAAFDTWFEGTRRLAVYDNLTLDHLQRIAGDPIGLIPPQRSLNHDFLTQITRFDQGNYLAAAAGPDLTGPHYRGKVSSANQDRLREILSQSGLPQADAPLSKELQPDASRPERLDSP